MNDDQRIRHAFKRKNWNETRTNDSWGIFKVMSEFVAGYDTLSKIGPCVSIFGSARTLETDKYYINNNDEKIPQIYCSFKIYSKQNI